MDRSPACSTDTARYAKCIEVSRRVRRDIDKDVIRSRDFGCFRDNRKSDKSDENVRHLGEAVLAACRWPFIESGITHLRFRTTLLEMISQAQSDRIQTALGTVLNQTVN
jgi:hypothetical protein